MSMTVAVTMTMAVEMMKRSAKAAIGRIANDPAVDGAHRIAAGAAIHVRHEPHGGRAHRGASHHCEHDTARSFYDVAL